MTGQPNPASESLRRDGRISGSGSRASERGGKTSRLRRDGSLGGHAADNVHQAIESDQVAVLPVAFYPGGPVVELLPLRKGRGLPKVNHPDFGPPLTVMHKQQGTANHLEAEIERQTGRSVTGETEGRRGEEEAGGGKTRNTMRTQEKAERRGKNTLSI